MIPFEQHQTVEVLYETFSKDVYNPTRSSVLPNEFAINLLFQYTKQQFVEEFIVEEKPFILSGPEFNNL